jgi:hypothetical protein
MHVRFFHYFILVGEVYCQIPKKISQDGLPTIVIEF